MIRACKDSSARRITAVMYVLFESSGNAADSLIQGLNTPMLDKTRKTDHERQ